MLKEQLAESKANEAKAEATKLVESKVEIAEDKYAPKEDLTLCLNLSKRKKRNYGFLRKC